MKTFLKYSFAIICLSLFIGCEDADDGTNTDLNYLTFESDSYDFGVDIGGSTTNQVNVYTGNVTNSARTFSVSVDADNTSLMSGAYTVPSSITIPAGSNETAMEIQISDMGIGPAGETLALAFNDDQGIFTSDMIVLNVFQVCPNDESTVSFLLDGYGSEVTWTIMDASGTVVSAGGPYADGDASASASACLIVGSTYTWTINDSFGDGLSFPANGTATITYNGNVLSTVTGNYGSQYVDTFTVE